eukprot:1968235-Rhodomonas_salina.1
MSTLRARADNALRQVRSALSCPRVCYMCCGADLASSTAPASTETPTFTTRARSWRGPWTY